MIIRVSDIEQDGVTIDDGTAALSPFPDASWHLDRLRLRLEREDQDVIVQGEIDARVSETCGRCLETFPTVVHADVDLRMVPRPSAAHNVELGADDLDVDFYEGDELNIDALIATETALALPMKPLCRDDCRGLCPVCGANRNLTPCACRPGPSDPRGAALRTLVARRSP